MTVVYVITHCITDRIVIRHQRHWSSFDWLILILMWLQKSLNLFPSLENFTCNQLFVVWGHTQFFVYMINFYRRIVKILKLSFLFNQKLGTYLALRYEIVGIRTKNRIFKSRTMIWTCILSARQFIRSLLRGFRALFKTPTIINLLNL